MHFNNAPSGFDTGMQFTGVHQFGQEIIRTDLMAAL
tara:strand:- start:1008 stop:1115 length:108 start_codon:yes stop_codon:yes gene_type:complete